MTVETSTSTSSSWRTDAACAGQSTDWWFSDDGFERAVAVSICRTCPVKTECLTEAFAEETGWVPRYGVRGGVTASGRAAIARTSRPVTVETHRPTASG